MERKKKSRNKFQLFRQKIKSFNKRNGRVSVIVLIAICFPGILWALGAWAFHFITPNYGEILSYFGVLFGILGSFITYRAEKEKESTQRRKDLKPQPMVKLLEDADEQYRLEIMNCGEEPLRMVYYEGDFVTAYIEKRHELDITYESDEECPKHIQICCNDREGNIWAFDFNKMYEDDKPYYYPVECYLI